MRIIGGGQTRLNNVHHIVDHLGALWFQQLWQADAQAKKAKQWHETPHDDLRSKYFVSVGQCL